MSAAVAVKTGVVQFGDTELQTWRSERTGKPYVAVKHVCQAIGVDTYSQTSKLFSNPYYKGLTETIDILTAGGPQRAVGLDIEHVEFWLCTIGIARVRSDVQERLLEFQRECGKVLHDYWSRAAVVREIEQPTYIGGSTKGVSHNLTPLQHFEFIKELTDYFQTHNGLTPDVQSELCQAARKVLATL